MMTKPSVPTSLRVLLVEDDEDHALLITRELERGGYDPNITRVATPEALQTALDSGEWDLVISDYRLPLMTGLEALAMVKASGQPVPFLIVSGAVGEETAVATMRAGASDYILKSNLARLVPAVERELREAEGRRARVRAEEALRESEARFRALFEQSNDAIYLTTNDGTIVDANQAALDLFGLSSDEITKTNAYDLFADAAVRAEFRRQLEELGAVRDFEVKLQRKDGKELDCLISSTTRRTDEAGVAGYQGLVRDVTARKRAEEALRRERDLSRSLIEAASTFFVTLSPDGKILAMNTAMLDALGYRPDEVVGADYVAKFIPESERETLRSVLETVARTKQAVTTRTHHVVGKSGRRCFVEWHGGVVLKENRDLDYSFAVGVDTTERVRADHDKKKLEAQLRQAQKMESLGTLAGGIAHDFNNILLAISGYAELTRDILPKDSTARENLTQVLQASRRAQNLVEQILAFSRQTEPELNPVELHPVVAEALALLRATLPATIEIRDRLKNVGTVLGDGGQIHQVLLNLGSNSAYAMRERGGVLGVSLETVDVDAHLARRIGSITPGSYARLSVRDTGHGMDRATLARIFDPFFTTKEVGDGTGLGLSVVHGIMSNHKGAITAESVPGHGTTVHMYFPTARGAGSSQAELEEPVHRGSERVLFVDDEKQIIALGRRMLKELGYRVTTRAGGQEALRTFRKTPDAFDLVVTDQTMPQLTGLELAAEIKRLRPDIPVVLSTGFSDAVTPERTTQLGISAVIMKPYGRSEIARVVRRALDGAIGLRSSRPGDSQTSAGGGA